MTTYPIDVRATRQHFQHFTSGYFEPRVCTAQQPNILDVQACIPKIIFIVKLKKKFNANVL